MQLQFWSYSTAKGMEKSWGSVAAAVLELQYCYRNEIKLGSVAAAVLELQYCYRNGIKLG